MQEWKQIKVILFYVDKTTHFHNKYYLVFLSGFSIYSVDMEIRRFQLIDSFKGLKKVQVDNDQETGQSEGNSHSKNRGGKKLN